MRTIWEWIDCAWTLVSVPDTVHLPDVVRDATHCYKSAGGGLPALPQDTVILASPFYGSSVFPEGGNGAEMLVPGDEALAVPEPAGWEVLGVGLVVVWALRTRGRKGHGKAMAKPSHGPGTRARPTGAPP